jgi:hypothetical protein
MQYPSETLLCYDLWRSLYYWHIQPPGYNLIYGIALKVMGNQHDIFLHLWNMLIGICAMLAIYASMIRLRIPRWYAIAATSLFFCGPACIQYENINFYSYSVMSLLCIAMYMGVRFSESQAIRFGLMFFMALAIVILTRSMFHLAWLALTAVVALLVYANRQWKMVLYSAMIPALLVAAFYTKNYVHFHTFGGCTLMGIGLSKLTTFALPESTRTAMYQSGELSKSSTVPPLNGLWKYERAGVIDQYCAPTGIPVLDESFFDDQSNNHNNLYLLPVNRDYTKDALVTLRKYPDIYLRSIRRSFACFFIPTGEWSWFIGRNSAGDNLNRNSIMAWDRFYRIVFAGQMPVDTPPSGAPYQTYATSLANIGWFGLIAFILAIISGIYRFNHNRFVVSFLAMTILYVFALSVFLETGESMRYRFNIEPYTIVLIGLLVSGKARKRNEGISH